MSNAWIDDGFYGQPWVRSCGTLAASAYLAATNVIHRLARDVPFVTRQELEDELPWPISESDMETAIQRLVARDRFALDGDRIELPFYAVEQERNSSRIDRAARNARNAAAGILARERDPKTGRLLPATHQPLAGSSSHSLEKSLASPASGPVRSDPIQKEAASPQSPPMASTGAVEGKPRKKREKRPAHPNYKPTLDAIDAIYREATGSKPDWSSPKERAAVDRLARSWTLDEILTRARRFWIDHLPGFAWQGKVTVLCVADFAAHFPRLAVIESRNGHHSNGLPDDFVQQRVY